MNITPGLTASDSYLRALPEVVAAVVNGCGPGGWKYDLVPDTILGLCIKEACNIHDWDYNEGGTKEDKDRADERFKKNVLYLVNTARGFEALLLRDERRILAEAYYEAVHLFGHDAFWAGKENYTRRSDSVKNRLLGHIWTTSAGIAGGAVTGAGYAVIEQLKMPGAQVDLKQVAINGAIAGACAGVIGAIGGAAKDPGKTK